MVSGIDGVAMKNNLFKKSMLLVMVPIIIISVVIIFLTRQGIKGYFEKESFDVLNKEIENLQSSDSSLAPDKLERPLAPEENQGGRPPLNAIPPAFMKSNKSTRSTIIVEGNNGKYRVPGDAEIFILLEGENIKSNESWPLHGQTTIQSETVFYAITPIDADDSVSLGFGEQYKNLYYLAYISESYSEDVTYAVMVIFVIGLMVLIALIALVLFVVFRKITVRLKVLETGTQKIGKGEFDTEISIKSYDEIGRLGEAMNRMGKQLGMNQDEQAENFQMISHELKTPIMVMQGYIDAMIHDQYPSGSKESTMNILVTELDKLENLTKDILFMNKSEYLAKNNIVLTQLSLRELFEDVTKRLNRDASIKIGCHGEHELLGDKDSWLRVIENIISNQLRYAKTTININLSTMISVKNDGAHIEPLLISKIKKPFVKGESGRSGLGLTIIDHTLKLYDYELSISNCTEGVEYLIQKV